MQTRIQEHAIIVEYSGTAGPVSSGHVQLSFESAPQILEQTMTRHIEETDRFAYLRISQVLTCCDPVSWKTTSAAQIL